MATNDPLLLPGQSRLGAFQTLMSLVARLVGSAANIRDIHEDQARAYVSGRCCPAYPGGVGPR